MGITMIKQFQCDKCGNLKNRNDGTGMPSGWTVMELTRYPYIDTTGERFVLCKQCHDWINRWMES